MESGQGDGASAIRQKILPCKSDYLERDSRFKQGFGRATCIANLKSQLALFDPTCFKKVAFLEA